MLPDEGERKGFPECRQSDLGCHFEEEGGAPRLRLDTDADAVTPAAPPDPDASIAAN